MSLFLNYAQWREDQLNIAEDTNPLVDCPECDGRTFIECSECGSEKFCHDCEEGKVLWRDITNYKRDIHFTKALYRKILLDDARAYSDWTLKDLSLLLVECGFNPYMSIKSKTTYI